ncbi:uncharacterized protein LOC109853104 [Pseudomyrmex gracilis]|uniref:uncharacterized protein LOC109853104 n=1 Tax=Pseudomyrmex gracilis TaxID=219809 RepID=UPI000995D321|nr:uncharacterized protein LOC109853104 [Pseudomyrmex gracilis]
MGSGQKIPPIEDTLQGRREDSVSHVFHVTLLPAWVASELCIRFLEVNTNLLNNSRRFNLWNAATQEFDKLEALTENGTAFCSIDQVSDARGETLAVSVEVMYPFVILDRRTNKLTGFIGDIWTILEGLLKFKTTYSKLIKQVYQTPKNRIADLNKGDVHAILSAIVISRSSSNTFIYSSPLTVNSYHLFVRSEGTTVANWMFINIFRWDLWVTLFATIFGIACVILGISYIKKHMNISDLDDEFASPVFAFLYVLAGLSGQGFSKVPESSSMRIIMILCLMMGMIMMYTFNSSLTSYLANKGRFLPLANIGDVLTKRTHSLCLRNTSNAYAYFTVKNEPESDLQDEWKGLINAKNCPDMTDTETLASKLCRPRVAYLEGAHVFLPVYHQVEHVCNIVQVPGSYWEVILVFVHSRSSRYRQLLNNYLLRMRSAGIIKYMEKKWKIHESRGQSAHLQPSSFHPVEYEHIAKSIILFSFFIFISVIICIFENIWYRKTQRQYGEKNGISISLEQPMYGCGPRATKITPRRRLRPKWRRKSGPILLSKEKQQIFASQFIK